MEAAASDPLIGAADLLARMGEARLRIADVRWILGEPERGFADYQAGHIPGAIFVDLERDLSAAQGPGRHPLPDPVGFADRLGGLGFGDEHDIVIYDGVGGRYGARLWWMLDRLGHRNVAVLDGGLPTWQAAGGDLSVGRPTPLRATLTLKPRWSGIIDRETLSDQQGQLDLIDVRAEARYRGEVEPMEAVAGHIPGARNRSCEILVADDGIMLSPDQLQVILRAHGQRAGQPTVVSCGSGVTACFGALAHRVAGLADPVLYPGSYSDWVGSGMPVVTGEEPYEVSEL
jgi:thiosulfate/3-mercaptopyruvate sulfurtransferase